MFCYCSLNLYFFANMIFSSCHVEICRDHIIVLELLFLSASIVVDLDNIHKF